MTKTTEQGSRGLTLFIVKDEFGQHDDVVDEEGQLGVLRRRVLGRRMHRLHTGKASVANQQSVVPYLLPIVPPVPDHFITRQMHGRKRHLRGTRSSFRQARASMTADLDFRCKTGRVFGEECDEGLELEAQHVAHVGVVLQRDLELLRSVPAASEEAKRTGGKSGEWEMTATM